MRNLVLLRRVFLIVAVAFVAPACGSDGGAVSFLRPPAPAPAAPPVTPVPPVPVPPVPPVSWPPGNTPLVTATGAQLNPRSVPDGSGGAIVVWQDDRSGLGLDIYAQRVSDVGVPLWAVDGVVVCTAAGEQSNPRIASDGAGGAIIVWQDARGGATFNLYAQRLNGSGALLWSAVGQPICLELGDQIEPQVVPDGQGGAVATWTDSRTGQSEIYAQRVNENGATQWIGDGVTICTKSCSVPQLDMDGTGGAIIVWQDYRVGLSNDIYAQRIDGTGTVRWTTDGVPICAAADYQFAPQLVSDGSGGAFVTWSDARIGQLEADIYAQHVNDAGTPSWAVNGLAVCTAASVQNWPQIIADGSGGAILVWQDYRAGTAPHIYTQRVSGAGALLWTANGVPACLAANFESLPQIASDGAGGAVLVWEDYRTGRFDVYAQRVDGSGVMQWTTDGEGLCTAADNQERPRILLSAPGHWIVVWEDYRTGSTPDIYAQGVDADGN